MNKKNTIILILGLVVLIVIAIVLAVILDRNTRVPNDSNSNSNSNEVVQTNDTIVIDYQTYQELRSEVHENETFAIVIMKSNDNISKTFKDEILYTFKDKKSKIYELDVDKISETEYSSVISDVTKIMNYDKPSITIPTLLISKKGKIVYKHAGLIYSPELSDAIKDSKIE